MNNTQKMVSKILAPKPKTDKHFFGRFWQVDCKDKTGGEHSWRFQHSDEGKRMACGFAAWLRRTHKGEYTSFIVWDK